MEDAELDTTTLRPHAGAQGVVGSWGGVRETRFWSARRSKSKFWTPRTRLAGATQSVPNATYSKYNGENSTLQSGGPRCARCADGAGVREKPALQSGGLAVPAQSSLRSVRRWRGCQWTAAAGKKAGRRPVVCSMGTRMNSYARTMTAERSVAAAIEGGELLVEQDCALSMRGSCSCSRLGGSWKMFVAFGDGVGRVQRVLSADGRPPPRGARCVCVLTFVQHYAP